MADIAIRLEKLSKAYRIGEAERRHETLLGAAMAVVRAPFRNFRRLRGLRHFDELALTGGRTARKRAEDRTAGGNGLSSIVWALRDVSLTINAGEVVGVIGRNGAGKSTFLKILSRITEPTSGRARVCGRVSSLLEVGTGFHPDLTGRENVYLNATILGMRKREVDQKFDEIVAFSGVERFIDTPVKRYSSGMRVRLAFSVAAHLEPEILLVDEVLAVGDAAFQQKCLGQMDEVARHGRTVLFVSHNMGAVTTLCHRGIWIENGSIADDGPVEAVARHYLQSTLGENNTFKYKNDSYNFAIEEVVLRNCHGTQTSRFSPGEDLIVEVQFDAIRHLEQPNFWLKVQSIHGPSFAADMQLDGHRPAVVIGRNCLLCRFKSIPLLPGAYSLAMGVRDRMSGVIMLGKDVASFVVDGDLKRHGLRGDMLNALSRATPVMIPYEWVLPDGQTRSVAIQ